MKKMYGQGMAIPEKSLKDRIAWHKAQALFDGPTHPVFLRVGQRDKDTYFIDLGDKEGRAVKITSSGWELVAPPPIFFRRTIGMLPLPEPERGGSIDDLRPFANVSEDNFIMSVAWLLAALRPFGPYPPLILQGLTGRTKTTYAEFLIDLVDPNTIPVRDPPGCVDDLLVSALYSHALSFDNISKLSLSLSNALCRMSTGVGSVKREFYTRRQQVRFPQAAHPFILNGIDDFVTRADLQNRSGQIEMEKVLERKELEALKAEFAAARPRIFGALLDRMVVGLRNLPSTSVPDLTRKNPDLLRMIDFIKWVVACGFDNFLEIYEQNLLGSAYAILDGNELASAIKALMHHREQQGLTQPWRGNATELAETLKRHGYKPPADNPRRGAAGGIEAAGATVTQCVQHRSRLPKAQERHAVDRNFIIAVTTVTKDHAGLKR